MKTVLISIFCSVLFISNGFSQTTDERNKQRYEAEVEQKKMDYINDFIATLKVDDFQKEIIMQNMASYFDELTKINLLKLRDYERKAQIDILDDSHFTDLKAVITEEQMFKVMDAIKGKWDYDEVKKKKKKEKKKRKKKNKS